MRIRKLMLGLASAALCVGVTATAAQAQGGPAVPGGHHIAAAKRVTIGVTLENITDSTPYPFMNRSGGGHVIGTPIGGYGTFDDNDDFTFEFYPTTKCGDNKVHNGEGGIYCPFTNGSGLNSRYDGADILAIHEYTYGYYAVIPNFGNGKLTLGNFASQGDTYVRNSAGYLVSVGESNYAYGQGFGWNKPYWVDSSGVSGAQLEAAQPANSGPWDCSTVGNAHQDAC